MSNKKTLKEFALSSWAIENRMTVFVITAIILIGGIFSYVTLPREFNPKIANEYVYISSFYPGNSAEDVEKFVTRPLEDQIREIAGILKVTAKSSQDYSFIAIEFERGTSIEGAKIEVGDEVDAITGRDDWATLDTGEKVEPYIFDLTNDELTPLLNIILTGEFISPEKMKEYAEILEDRIEVLPEIQKVTLLGIEEREIEVAVNYLKMKASNVSMEQIIQAIQKENLTISGGDIINNEIRRNIRIIGRIQKAKELENIVIKKENGIVLLKDIASIQFKRRDDRTTYARFYRKPAVMLAVNRISGKNSTIETSKKIRKLINDAKKDILPENLNISVVDDDSRNIKDRLSVLENTIIFGVLLVVIVLMFFLGLKNALFVSISIPLSMLMSFIMLSVAGISINVVVFFAFIVGLGMLVDNGIVVVENIHRLMRQGMPRMQAAKEGIGEIAWPIITSTATTLAAFSPLLFWNTDVGKSMSFVPLTLCILLISCLFIALVINASLTSVFMEIEEKEINTKKLKWISLAFLIFGILLWIGGWTGYNKFFLLFAFAVFLIGGVRFYLGWRKKESNKGLKQGIGIIGLSFIFLLPGVFSFPKALIGFGTLFVFLSGLFWVYKKLILPASKKFQHSFLPLLERKYKRFLEFVLRKNAYRFFFGAIGLLFIAIVLFFVSRPKVLFFPVNEPNHVYVYVEYPEGTDIEKTKRLTQELEDKIIDVVDQYKVEENGKEYNFMVESVISQVGEGGGDPVIDRGMENSYPYKGKVTVSFREFKDRRGISSSRVMEEIRQVTQGYPGVSISVGKNRIGSDEYPINIEVQGQGEESYLQLVNIASGMRSYIDQANIQGIEELKMDVNLDKPELEVYIDREKAGQLGISTRDIGYGLRRSVYGLDASTFRRERNDYDIFVRFDKQSRYNINDLLTQPITFADQVSDTRLSIPISSVVSTKKVETFSAIRRENFNRSITIYSNMLEGYNANEIVEKIKGRLADYPLPDGTTYQFTGEQEDQEENASFLFRALIIALGLVIFITVAQFNSLFKSIIILMSVILSFMGVLFGLVIFNLDFVIAMTMVGLIALVGIVVNNAIVLTDYTQLLVDWKKEELGLSKSDSLSREQYFDAIVQAGASRLRPVILTAITAMLGLLPIATELNINFLSLFSEFDPKIYFGGDGQTFWKPVAQTIIFGLSFATFLTLIIVPVMLYLLERAKIRFARKA